MSITLVGYFQMKSGLNGKYMGSAPDGAVRCVDEPDYGNYKTTWYADTDEKGVTFKSYFGRYLSAPLVGSPACSRLEAKMWEHFFVKQSESPCMFSMRCGNAWLSCERNGCMVCHFFFKSFDEWELEPVPAPVITHTIALHSWIPSRFPIPVNCGCCAYLMWGPAVQGYTCAVCHFRVHSKCLPAVPSNCNPDLKDAMNSMEISQSKAEQDDSPASKTKRMTIAINVCTGPSLNEEELLSQVKTEEQKRLTIRFYGRALNLTESEVVEKLDQLDSAGVLPTEPPAIATNTTVPSLTSSSEARRTISPGSNGSCNESNPTLLPQEPPATSLPSLLAPKTGQSTSLAVGNLPKRQSVLVGQSPEVQTSSLANNFLECPSNAVTVVASTPSPSQEIVTQVPTTAPKSRALPVVPSDKPYKPMARHQSIYVPNSNAHVQSSTPSASAPAPNFRRTMSFDSPPSHLSPNLQSKPMVHQRSVTPPSLSTKPENQQITTPTTTPMTPNATALSEPAVSPATVPAVTVNEIKVPMPSPVQSPVQPPPPPVQVPAQPPAQTPAQVPVQPPAQIRAQSPPPPAQVPAQLPGELPVKSSAVRTSLPRPIPSVNKAAPPLTDANQSLSGPANPNQERTPPAATKPSSGTPINLSSSLPPSSRPVAAKVNAPSKVMQRFPPCAIPTPESKSPSEVHKPLAPKKGTQLQQRMNLAQFEMALMKGAVGGAVAKSPIGGTPLELSGVAPAIVTPQPVEVQIEYTGELGLPQSTAPRLEHVKRAAPKGRKPPTHVTAHQE